MSQAGHRWGAMVQLRPDQLQEIVERTPVAYWPLGLIEHHGWHLPVGFDGLKAERLCRRFAGRTGGVVLPVMWWGGGGGHGGFRWTFYQPLDAARAVLENTLRKLVAFGFRCVVLLAGHYPWQGLIREVLPALEEEHPEVLVIAGTEANVGAPEVRLRGDHAARWETSYGLALLPELVDLSALREGRTEAVVWPGGAAPEGERHPSVMFDADSPLFAQAGEDARTADAREAEEMLERLVEHVAARVTMHLSHGD